MEHENPKVAPGINYNDEWEDADKKDKKNNNVTKIIRLVFDEYDPSDGK